MNRKVILTAFIVVLIICVEGRKTSSRSRSSGSGRGTSRKTNYNPQPAPTSFSNPQPSAPKPSLFGWQEKPAQKSQPLSSWQSKPSGGQGHSYPSSNTGLSGNQPKQPSNFQESVQRSSAPSNSANQQTRTNNQAGHSYPSSNGLSGSHPQQNGNTYPQQQGTGLSGSGQSGSSGYPQQQGPGLSAGGQSGSSYPQQYGSGLSGGSQTGSGGYPQPHGTGLSAGGQSGSSHLQNTGGGYPNNQGSGMAGSAVAPPPYSGYRPGDANHPYNSQSYQGSNYHHPQGPPPPYSSNYGGFGGHGSYSPGYSPQMPGYFGSYSSPGKGFGGVSRTGSALTGVGIAGAGIGTVLTGLALWNLARSTGNRHHTVIYDNRGQPVAVAPANDTTPATDPILADLVNCTLSISNGNTTEVLAIPCSIATSFTPETDVKDSHIKENTNDNTKCTVAVVTKSGKEFTTTIPCSILLNSAAENNVTEAPLVLDETGNITNVTNESLNLNATLPLTNPSPNKPTVPKLTEGDLDVGNNKQLNCTPHSGEIRDPINPCYSVQHNLTVIPLSPNEPV